MGRFIKNNFLNSKVNYIKTMIVVFMVFVISTFWIWCGISEINYQKEKIRNAQMISEVVKVSFEESRLSIKKFEPVIDEYMETMLITIGNDIESEEDITEQTLVRISQEKPITGVWIIEEDGMIRLASDGRHMSVKDWYKDRPEVKWEQKFDWLLNNEGAIWVDTFSKMETPPYSYLKWGYMGLGEVKGLGKVILEIGVSVDDIKHSSPNTLKDSIKEDIVAHKNLTSVDFKIQNPDEEKPKKLKNNIHEVDGQQVKTYITAKDFNNDETQIIVTTDYPEIQKLQFTTFVITLLSTAFIVGTLVFFLHGLKRFK